MDTQVTIRENKFGDVLVHLARGDEKSCAVEDMSEAKKNRAIYTFPVKGALAIATHPKEGKLYAYPPVYQTFPYIKDGYILGSAVVTTFKKKSKTWFVVVKPHDRSYLMNPGGAVNLVDVAEGQPMEEMHKNAAINEAREETGVDISNLKNIARWVHPRNYANLAWLSLTNGFAAVADQLPKYILEALGNDKEALYHVLPLPQNEGYDCAEISHVVVFSEEMLEKIVLEGIVVGGKTCALEKHHGALALHVGKQYCPHSHNGLVKHLSEFTFSANSL